MNCPYCNAELPDDADRCTTCLKHLPHKDTAYTPVQSSDIAQAGASFNASLSQPAVTDIPLTVSAPAAAAVQPVQPTQPTSPAQLLEPVVIKNPVEPVSPAVFGRILGVGIIAGLAVGGLYFAISRVFEAFIIFPLLAGFITGAITGTQITATKARNVRIALLCGFIAGVICYSTKIVAEAYGVRSEIIAKAVPDLMRDEGMTQAQATSFAESHLTPLKTMQLYFEFYGVTIGSTSDTSSSSSGSESSDPAITGVGFWVLCGIECLLVAGCSAGTCMGAANASYCESCSMWRKTENVTKKHSTQGQLLVDLARKQDWASAKAMPTAGVISDKAYSVMSAIYCPTCKSGLVQVRTVGRGGNKKMFTSELTPESMAALRGIPIAPTVSAPVS
jgi:hypothetical protein